MRNTWFITGTSSGLGRRLTELLLDRGDRVAATLRRADALDDLRVGAGDRLWVAHMDVTDRSQVQSVLAKAFDDLGEIDVIVNNAGFGVYGSVEEVSEEQIRQVIETNLFGSINVVRAALPHLRAQGRGRIVEVSSAGGQTTYPNFGYYHAAKAGIEALCETAAKEVAPLGIEITIVEPGTTPTGFDDAVSEGCVAAALSRGGRVLWRTPLPAPTFAAPALGGERLHVAGSDGTLRELDTGSGGIVARALLGAPSSAAPAIAAGKLVVGTGAEPYIPGDQLVCLG